MATDTMSLVEKCQELAREHGGKVNTALATLMLACQMNVANAQTVPVNPADSANAGAAKGFGQVVNTPFGELSFAQIQKHPKKEEILDDVMTPEQSKAYITWIKGNTQVAIKEGDIVAERKQVAIKEGDIVAERKQVAIKEGDIVAERKQVVISDIIQRVPQIIPVYEMKTARGEKLTREEGETLQYILSLGEPKDWLPRIQKLLSNPQNFA